MKPTAKKIACIAALCGALAGGVEPIRTAIQNQFISGELLVTLAESEQYRERAYIPTKGDVWTIGYGSTTDVKKGDKTTPARALARLYTESNDRYAEGVKRCVTAPVSAGEFDALVYSAYKMGVRGICISPVVAKTNAGDYRGACDAYIGYRETVAGRDCNIRSNQCYGVVKDRIRARDMCMGVEHG